MKPASIILFIILSLKSFSQQDSLWYSATQKDYIFFLHNRFVEENDLSAKHPEYGRAEYKEIINEFVKEGFVVISEKRTAKTDVNSYANKVIKQIDSLKTLGVKADHITVVGTSKGGYIAQVISSTLKDPDVNYVFIGCFQEEDLKEMPYINYCGNILTIYESSDPYGVSAIKRRNASKLAIKHFKEIELNTGLKHGFLFKPLKQWILPCQKWARRNYALK